MVDIYRDAKLFTDPEGDSCFSIYQNRWIKKMLFQLMASISSSETFAKRLAIFLSVRKTVNIQGYSKFQSKRAKIAIH